MRSLGRTAYIEAVFTALLNEIPMELSFEQ